ncbi:hypothetical protein ALC62_01893 [Cyphomyrmex costatus]|uniref:DUF8207 domain-containing protein n=1 Tax=Cyphomyrmex costatus TaxID=456900 RepID=A0A151INY4_9HYME|nr:hypothetical protein ALC62_01893 [Cyphomyrmex costatus]
MSNVREKIARETEKTSESIRKKHRALKTDSRYPIKIREPRDFASSLGLLSLKYVEPILRGHNESGIDHVYGAYLDKDGLILGNKRFDVDDADNIIIDSVRYAAQWGQNGFARTN